MKPETTIIAAIQQVNKGVPKSVVARTYGVSPGTVKNWMNKAPRLLRNQIAPPVEQTRPRLEEVRRAIDTLKSAGLL